MAAGDPVAQSENRVQGNMAMTRTNSLMVIALGAMATLAPAHTFAGGLYLNQAGTGAGNPANHSTASTAWLNPAGMTGLKESSVDVSGGLLIPWVKFDPSIAQAGGNDGNNAGSLALLPSVYAVKKLSDKWALGFTMTAPFGGGVEYGDNFVGRYGAQRAMLSGAGLGPSVGYKVNDKLSIGGGMQFQYSKFDMKLAVNTPGPLPDGTAKANGLDGWGEQYFGGLTYHITRGTTIGVLYKSKSDVDIDGDLEFGNLPVQVPDANLDITWTLPQLVAIGLEHAINDRLIAYLDVNWQDWSQFRHNQLTASFANNTGGVNVIDRNWSDTWHGGAGLLYMGGKYVYSAGVTYDSSPVSDTYRTIDLPIDDALKIIVGVLKPGKTVDYGLGATALFLGDAKVDQVAQGVRFAGKFDTNVLLILGATATFRF